VKVAKIYLAKSGEVCGKRQCEVESKGGLHCFEPKYCEYQILRERASRAAWASAIADEATEISVLLKEVLEGVAMDKNIRDVQWAARLKVIALRETLREVGK
jgi:hypothetical protein